MRGVHCGGRPGLSDGTARIGSIDGSLYLKRVGVIVLTALCLTFVVFFLTNLEPNLEKLTKSEGNQRA